MRWPRASSVRMVRGVEVFCQHESTLIKRYILVRCQQLSGYVHSDP